MAEQLWHSPCLVGSLRGSEISSLAPLSSMEVPVETGAFLTRLPALSVLGFAGLRCFVITLPCSALLRDPSKDSDLICSACFSA